MRVDARWFVDELLRERVGSQSKEDEERLADWEEIIDHLRLHFWINKQTFVVSQLELD